MFNFAMRNLLIAKIKDIIILGEMKFKKLDADEITPEELLI